MCCSTKKQNEASTTAGRKSFRKVCIQLTGFSLSYISYIRSQFPRLSPQPVISYQNDLVYSVAGNRRPLQNVATEWQEQLRVSNSLFRTMWCFPPFLEFMHLAMGLNWGHELTGLHRLTWSIVAVIYCYNFQYGQGPKHTIFVTGILGILTSPRLQIYAGEFQKSWYPIH